MIPTTRPAEAKIRWPRIDLRDSRIRTVAWQMAVVAGVCIVAAIVSRQTAANLQARGIASGFDYLRRAAGFEIAEGLLPYSGRDTYARALAAGLLNTIRVALPGILIASGLGLLVGVGRLSSLWIVSAASAVYVEVLRSTPLLLQLLFWYALSQMLPDPREALSPIAGVFASNRGLFVPSLWWHDGVIALDRPVLVGFNFRGGTTLSPEFAALLIGLSTFTAASIAEIVRGSVLAVDRGQVEAAAALGLTKARILRLVVLPQALRLMLPPTTNQFVNLLKNSSLAVAIGYPDLISITNTTVNQTGQAIEAIGLATIIYLALNVIVATAMSLYSRAVAPRRTTATAS